LQILGVLLAKNGVTRVGINGKKGRAAIRADGGVFFKHLIRSGQQPPKLGRGGGPVAMKDSARSLRSGGQDVSFNSCVVLCFVGKTVTGCLLGLRWGFNPRRRGKYEGMRGGNFSVDRNGQRPQSADLRVWYCGMISGTETPERASTVWGIPRIVGIAREVLKGGVE